MGDMTQAEQEKLIMALAYGTQAEGFTREDVAVVFKEYRDAQIAAALWDMVLDGKVWLAVENGEVTFTNKPEEGQADAKP